MTDCQSLLNTNNLRKQRQISSADCTSTVDRRGCTAVVPTGRKQPQPKEIAVFGGCGSSVAGEKT